MGRNKVYPDCKKDAMKKLITHYTKGLYLSDNYYENIKALVKTDLKEYIGSNRFLEDVKFYKVEVKEPSIETYDGDSRIDVPVWIGNLNNALKKVLILGSEPRDTNSKFNLAKNGRKVFASPFGVDRWNTSSSVKRKPQNKYFRVFDAYLEDEDIFLLFSDFVKVYNVFSKGNNAKNDSKAKRNFKSLSQRWMPFLNKEIEIISPDVIIVFGNDANWAAEHNFSQNRMGIVKKVRHPSFGGERQAKLAIEQIIKGLRPIE